MRSLKFALAAVAAFGFGANANAAGNQFNGMGGGYAGSATPVPAAGVYQQPVEGNAPNSQAFHAGGVAACDGCHVMHNANNGVAKSTLAGSAVAPWTNVTNMFLLQGSDQSSTCLICHSGANTSGLQFTIADVTTAAIPSNRTPGGDFGWLKQAFQNSPGERHGHNVAAADFGLAVDGHLTIAPGGSFAGGAGKAQFACSNCHDPHGRYRMVNDASKSNGVGFIGPYSPQSFPIAASGSYGALPTATAGGTTGYAVGAYRLLAGQGYAPVSNAAYPFPNDPPVAVAPTLYNSSEATNEVRVAYGTGMSEWCQNCHTNVHFNSDTRAVGIAGFRHPAGSDATLAANQISIYNTYLSSGKVNPALTDNYTSLVPFEQGKTKGIAALAAKANASSIIAADAQANVMCLSCHRAHASAFDSMVRWDQQATFLTDGTNFTTGATGSTTSAFAGSPRTLAQTQAGYYDRTVGVAAKGSSTIGYYQRSMCNKCHGKD
jgi:predicted CXXCH cytochrome family protein